MSKQAHSELPHLLFRSRVQIFLSLIETRNFTATAERLGISQSAVSRSIRELEDDLGTELFVRQMRPVRLTEEGGYLNQVLRAEAKNLENAVAGIRSRSFLKSPLRLGITETLTASLATPIIRGMLPYVSNVVFQCGTVKFLLQRIDANELDFMIGPEPFRNRNDLVRHFLFSEPSVVVTPKGMPVAQPLTWETLRFCGLPMICHHRDSAGSQIEERLWSELNVDVARRIEADVDIVLMGLVAQGVGWSVTRPTTLHLYPALAAKVDVHPLPPTRLGHLERSLYLVGRKGVLPDLKDGILRFARNVVESELLPFVRAVGTVPLHDPQS